MVILKHCVLLLELKHNRTSSIKKKFQELTLNGTSLFPPQKCVKTGMLQLPKTRSEIVLNHIAITPSFMEDGYMTVIKTSQF
jgi:hypothetical protein